MQHEHKGGYLLILYTIVVKYPHKTSPLVQEIKESIHSPYIFQATFLPYNLSYHGNNEVELHPVENK